ncbi:MAG: hypothetical protein ABJC79_03010 [Acidimicrobiia bacterium]
MNGARGVLLATVFGISACSSGQSASPRPTTKTRRAPTTTEPSTTSTTTASSTDAVLAPPLLPLFPFQSEQEARAWTPSGPHPEYADPSGTALAFTSFLGYAEVDHVVTSVTDAKGRHVAVGSFVPGTSTLTTAAVVHLVRYGPGAGAPWEVVGTDDADFALTRPAYGATIGSPLTVGGRITGVDENIRIHVQQLHANRFLGEFCCVPAGGVGSAWTASVSFAAPTDPVLMVSASTGGHTRRIERFTVNAVKARTP